LFFYSAHFSDQDLRVLNKFHGLARLHLGMIPITDAGMKELAALKNLKDLDVNAPNLTDAGVKELNGLTKLTSAKLGGNLTEACLKDIALHKQLTQLHLNMGSFTK